MKVSRCQVGAPEVQITIARLFESQYEDEIGIWKCSGSSAIDDEIRSHFLFFIFEGVPDQVQFRTFALSLENCVGCSFNFKQRAFPPKHDFTIFRIKWK